MKHKFGSFLCVALLASLGWGQAISAPPVTTSQVIMPVYSVNLTPATSANTALVGNPGNQAVYYWMVSNFTLGSSSPVGPFVVLNAPNSLSASNYVNFTPNYPVGIASIDLLKTSTPIPPVGACNCAVSTGVTGGTIADQSNSTSSYTISPIVVGNYTLTLQNEVQSAGVTHLILRQNGTLVCDLSTGCGTSGITGATAGGGLVQTGSTLGLLRTCSSTQVLAWNGTAWACSSSGIGTVTGTGTSQTVPLWSSTSAIGNSLITQTSAGGTGYQFGSSGTQLSNVLPFTIWNAFSNSCAGSQTIPLEPNSSSTPCVSVNINSSTTTSNSTGTTLGFGVNHTSQEGLVMSGGFTAIGNGTATVEVRAVEADAYGNSSNLSTVRAFVGAPIYEAGGTLPTSQGYYARLFSNGSSTISNNYNFYADSPSLGGGTLTHNYGVYIADQTVGANNLDPWGIFEAGTAKNQLGGALTVPNLSDSALTPGDCVQASTGGLLTTTGSACGSGSGGANITVNGGSALTSPVNFQSGTNTTASNPSGSNVQYNVAAATTSALGVIKLAQDLGGTGLLPTVVGIDAVPLCSGFTPTNGQVLEYTTGSSPNPCYTAAANGGGLTGLNPGYPLTAATSTTVLTRPIYIAGSTGYVSGDACATISANISSYAPTAQGIILDLAGFSAFGATIPCLTNPFENQDVAGLVRLGPVKFVTSRAWVTPNARFSVSGTGTQNPAGGTQYNSVLAACTAEEPGWNGTACVINGTTVPTLANGGGHSVTFTYPHGPFGAATYYPLFWDGGQGASTVACGGFFGHKNSEFTLDAGGPGGADFAYYNCGGQEDSAVESVVGRACNGACGFYDGVAATSSGPTHFRVWGGEYRMDAGDTPAQGYPNEANQIGLGYGWFIERQGDPVWFSGANCSVYPQGYPATFSAGAISTIQMTYAGSCTAAPTCHISTARGGSGATCTATYAGGAVTAINVTAGGSGYSVGDTGGGGPFQFGGMTINATNAQVMQEGAVFDGLYDFDIGPVHCEYLTGYCAHVGYGNGFMQYGTVHNIDLGNSGQGPVRLGSGIDNNQWVTSIGKGVSGFGILDDPNSFSTVGPIATYQPGGMVVLNSLTVPTATISGLTPGDCVQAGVDGLLTSSTGGCSDATGTVTTSSNTQRTIAMFTSNGPIIGNSLLTQDSGATTVTVTGSEVVTGTLSVTGATSITASTLSLSANGAASASPFDMTGTPYAGTGTTSTPLVYLNDGTAPSTWSTAGTEFGENAPSGFTGNLLDFHVNGGASVAKLDYQGNLTVVSCTGCAASAVTSVSNSDGTLTVSPTTGAVVASIALGHADTWTATNTYSKSGTAVTLTGAPTGTGTPNLFLNYAGTFSGSASGTAIGVSQTGTANFFDFQTSGTSMGTLSSAGALVVRSSITAAGGTFVAGDASTFPGAYEIHDGNTANIVTLGPPAANFSGSYTLTPFASIPTNNHMAYVNVGGSVATLTDTGYAYNAIPTADLAPVPLTSGTSVSLSGPSAFFSCTSTCTVTPPTPAAGYQFCVRNADNVSTVITLAALSGIQYENTARTSYKTANTSLASSGTVSDQICIGGLDSTHYIVWSFTGAWI